MLLKLTLLISKFFWLFSFMSIGIVAYIWVNKRKKHHKSAKKALVQAVKKKLHEPMTLHPEINKSQCVGCGSCVKACPEGEIIQLIDHKAHLVSASKCVGHGLCEEACPVGAISLVFGTKTKGMEIPRLTTNYETNLSGSYIAGELGGMGLIRNAVRQGQIAAMHALSHTEKNTQADVDLVIVGAGPAGLAASLAAIQMKRSYICLEQNSFGGTVYNFPRQKIVMTIPADLPLVGQMKFKSNNVSKEELLGFWHQIRKQFSINIHENTKFENFEKINGVFHIRTSKGIIKAKKVVLAMGVRGSPRKLGLANEDLSKVTYNLIDPEQYVAKNIAVVGGGNAALEAAQYLAKSKLQNKIVLLVRGEIMDRANEENQKIIESLVAKGIIKLWFNSSVKEIHLDHLIVNRNGHEVKIPNDYVFIFAGAEMPFKFLLGLGIKIDKKFGETLKKVG